MPGQCICGSQASVPWHCLEAGLSVRRDALFFDHVGRVTVRQHLGARRTIQVATILPLMGSSR